MYGVALLGDLLRRDKEVGGGVLSEELSSPLQVLPTGEEAALTLWSHRPLGCAPPPSDCEGGLEGMHGHELCLQPPSEVGKEGVSTRHMNVLCGRAGQGERERGWNIGDGEEKRGS